MTFIEYWKCDDCGKHTQTPWTVVPAERDDSDHIPTLSSPEPPAQPPIQHACSTLCLVRLTNELHRLDGTAL